MIYSIEVKSNQFVYLVPPCLAWQALVPISVGLQRGDSVKYIEVDNLGVPTGLSVIGDVVSVSSGWLKINEGSSVMFYCENIRL